MPIFAVILPLVASVSQQDNIPITVTAYAWAPFISPAGEPFRSHSSDDDPFARWFRRADLDHDGFLSAEELLSDAAAFFEVLDSDHDGAIGTEELVAYETEIAPEVQVNSNWKRTRKQASADGIGSERPRRRPEASVDGYQLNGLQGASRYSMLNIPEPVAGADFDLNGKITRAEFLSAASYRFGLLDTARKGRLGMEQLEAMVPSRPHSGRHAKPRPDAADQRIAIPLPKRQDFAVNPSANSSRSPGFEPSATPSPR